MAGCDAPRQRVLERLLRVELLRLLREQELDEALGVARVVGGVENADRGDEHQRTEIAVGEEDSSSL